MNVASKELCQELYELSGWADRNMTNYWTREGSLCHQDNWYDNNILNDMGGDIFPAYGLGYLLRKLPVYVPKPHDLAKDDVRHLILHPSDNDRWTTYYTHTDLLEEEDTPEDAACSLAIELWKQGILK